MESVSEKHFAINSYPKVYAIGHAAIADIFDGDVLVEEKVDGSQFSFMVRNPPAGTWRTDADIFMRSRGATINPGAADSKMFAAAIATVKGLAGYLHDGWIYRCEYLSKPKHNVLCYARVPRFNLILFDINTGNEIYLSRQEKEQEALRIGMEFVPGAFCGRVESPEHLLSFLERESVLGGQKVEGVVVKNYARFGKDKKVLMGKYVREDFKETHAKEWRAANPTVSDIVQRLIATLRSEKRWEKAVFHLRDKGQLDNSPRDIGSLMKAVQEDIAEEESEYIKTQLFNWALPRILRASASGLPEWYKKRLLESAFPSQE